MPVLLVVLLGDVVDALGEVPDLARGDTGHADASVGGHVNVVFPLHLRDLCDSEMKGEKEEKKK